MDPSELELQKLHPTLSDNWPSLRDFSGQTTDITPIAGPSGLELQKLHQTLSDNWPSLHDFSRQGTDIPLIAALATETNAPPAPPPPPDGGTLAWMQVAGSWCLWFAPWGLVNSFGGLLAHLQRWSASFESMS